MFAIGDEEWPGIAKMNEECGELIQVIGKLMGSSGDVNHWSGNLRDKLHEEMGDALAALNFVILHCDVDHQAIEKQRRKKLARFERWHADKTQPPGAYPEEYICKCVPDVEPDDGACEECLKRGHR